MGPRNEQTGLAIRKAYAIKWYWIININSYILLTDLLENKCHKSQIL